MRTSPSAAPSVRARPTWPGTGAAMTSPAWRGIILVRANREVLDDMEAGLAAHGTRAARLLHGLQPQHPARQRRNIAAHYDLGNDLFELFLDDTMMYSCAIFQHRGSTLHEASIAKLDASAASSTCGPTTTCWKSAPAGAASRSMRPPLRLPRDHHDDFARAVRPGAGSASRPRGSPIASRCCSRTIATSRPVRQAGVHRNDRGRRRASTSTPTSPSCSGLLKPDGRMLLQAITIADQLYDRR